MVWDSQDFFQDFSQFLVIHTVKGFGIVNKAEIGVFLELSCFFHEPADVGEANYNVMMPFLPLLGTFSALGGSFPPFFLEHVLL